MYRLQSLAEDGNIVCILYFVNIISLTIPLQRLR